jgi:hypothetical protein
MATQRTRTSSRAASSASTTLRCSDEKRTGLALPPLRRCELAAACCQPRAAIGGIVVGGAVEQLPIGGAPLSPFKSVDWPREKQERKRIRCACDSVRARVGGADERGLVSSRRTCALHAGVGEWETLAARFPRAKPWDVSLAVCPSNRNAMTSRVHKLPCSGLTAAASMQAAAGQRACALAPAACEARRFRGTTLPVPCCRAAARCARVVQASAALKPGAVAVAAGVAAATLATAQVRLNVP